MVDPETTESARRTENASIHIALPEWTVEIDSGPDQGKKITTLDGLIRLGTDSSNDLVLTDTQVSRRHLEIERRPRGFLLRDMGSKNGTWLDGREVIQAYVKPGDRISLGKSLTSISVGLQLNDVELLGAESFGELVGKSEGMRAVFAALKRLAKEELNLLLEGETGTGKELAARALHLNSNRQLGPFKVVDCNLLKPDTAEIDLFGDEAEEGVFESAAGGTIFLDEVGELPLAIQPKLLRVLESREFCRVGESRSLKLDARVIASTHRNLEEEVRLGNFRADLYFRLAVAKIRLPPLRTRREDLPILCQQILKKLGQPFELSSQTLSLFEGYEWPGNIRELRNVLERGALLQETGDSTWLDFLSNSPRLDSEVPLRSTLSMVAGMPYHEAKDRVLADFERLYLAEIIKQANFDLQVAEKQTGLSMQSLYRLLKKNGLRLRDLKNADKDV